MELFQIECKLCGNVQIVEKSHVLRKETGYKYCKMCFDNLKPGDRIGRLTLINNYIKEVGSNKMRLKYWVCKCDCGNTTNVSNYVLRKHGIKSCGKCDDIFKPTKSIHYNRAMNIMKRCKNKNHVDYPRYGGRGIKCLLGETIVEVIESLEKVPGYKPGLQIDRIDNDGDYTLYHPEHGYEVWYDEYGNPCKGNLRWVSPSINSSNRKQRVDFSRELLLKLFNEYNSIEYLQDIFCETYLVNYLYMFIFIPDDEVCPTSYKLILSPYYINDFERFVTDDDRKLFVSSAHDYTQEFLFELNKSKEIVQRLFLKRK